MERPGGFNSHNVGASGVDRAEVNGFEALVLGGSWSRMIR